MHVDASTTKRRGPLSLVTKPNASGNYVPCPAGIHKAVLVAIVDLGTHVKTFRNGGRGPWHEVALVWEVAERLRPDGLPFLLVRQYTASLAEGTNLRGLLETLDRQKFADELDVELEDYLGRPCLLKVSREVSPSGRLYHRIDDVLVLDQGMAAPEHTRDLLYFDTDLGEPGPGFDDLPLVFVDGQLTPIVAAIESSAEREAQRAVAASGNGRGSSPGPREDRSPSERPGADV
jgi:hypothetical protein